MEEDNKKQDDRDRFTRLMFGSGGGNEKKVTQPTTDPSQASIDFDELMVNIDSLVESAKNLKPLFQKVYPLVEQIWKKK
jgi:hypothetical protein